jgi:CHAT domain-containing protein
MLLNGELAQGLKQIGGVEVVHFAGHGEVDPTRPGEAALFLSNGKPMNPIFLRRSKLGKNHAPFIFLNACMVGTGGQLLGDYGGFPGNCLAGGFTGLVAPLWAVNDTVAHSIAIDFYEALLAPGSDRTVAGLMRDVRAQYSSNAPISSYLAYVFYGNPNLKVARA